MAEKEYVIDCSSRILGRLASRTAKMLLEGKTIKLVNAEKAMISGHPTQIVASYKRKIELIDKANPEHSPYWPRRPDFLVKRIVRGMLPFKKPKGQAAFRRLMVYIGVPAELKNAKMEKLETKEVGEIYETSITVKELAERLGYRLN